MPKEDSKAKPCMSHASCKGGDAVYGLGLVGAVVYFFQTSPTLGEKLFGLLKALVWPALLVHKALELISM